MLGLFLGSTIGGYLPVLFGASVLSSTSLIFSAVGGIAGIYLTYKISANW